jgi:methionine aminotransferase
MKSKLPQVGTTIFSVMSALAKEHNAINLSQGFPDFPVSSSLIQLVCEAMHNGQNQYAPMPGLPELRTILAKKVNSLYHQTINPDTEITITPGATYAIYTALTTILQPGDEVIVLEPAYDSYLPNIALNGAKAVCVPLCYPDFSIDWNAIQAKVNAHTKAIIINTPHNPTGSIWTKQDMAMLTELVKTHGLYVVSDEVYEHLVFDGQKHESILNYPDLFEHSFVIYSFGKLVHATGWKMGYCVAPKPLMDEYRKIHQFLSFSCHTPTQYALAKFLENEEEYLALPHFFQEKRDFFLNQIKDLPFTLHKVTSGSYFQLLGYDQISDLPDTEFAMWLTKEMGVATIPISAFHHDGRDHKLIRFCFAKQQSTLEQACERLRRLG